MHEDRAILDTIFSTNRKAILDLHNLDKSVGKVFQTACKDDRYGDASTSTSEIPQVAGGLSPFAGTASALSETTPRKSFSRRGMRLGVHMSILDLGAHPAPDALKDKWIQTSRSRHPIEPTMNGARSPEKVLSRFPLEDDPNKANLSPEKTNTSALKRSRKTSLGWISSSMAGKLHKMIDDLELAHSTGISRLAPHGRRRSSSSKHPTAAIEAEGLRQRRSSGTKQELGAVFKIGEGRK